MCLADDDAEHTETLRSALRGSSYRVIDARSESGGITPASLAVAVRACAAVPGLAVVALASTWASRPATDGAADLEAALLEISAIAQVVVSAGNRGSVEWPATLETVRSVGAVDEAGDGCGFSASRAAVDLVALGCGASQGAWGTSVAVALAAAQIASTGR